MAKLARRKTDVICSKRVKNEPWDALNIFLSAAYELLKKPQELRSPPCYPERVLIEARVS